MKSTGNDIVDLTRINRERTNLHKFYSRILTPAEKELYSNPQFLNFPFENYVWLLWSVKESAYKYSKRTNPEMIFSPTRILATEICLPSIMPDVSNSPRWVMGSCEEPFCTGVVSCGGVSLYFRSMVTKNWIASVVNNTPYFEAVHLGVRYISECSQPDLSASARAFLLEELKPLCDAELWLETSDVGYPVIMHGNEPVDGPASLSHHGSFVSFSFVQDAVLA